MTLDVVAPATTGPAATATTKSTRARLSGGMRAWWAPLLLHAPVFVAATLAVHLHRTGGLALSADQLVRWDGGFYTTIRDHGYLPSPRPPHLNAAFFPLFPYLWRVTGLGPLGISLLNLAMFLVALLALARELRPEPRTQLLFLATPSAIYFMVAYSESLLFAAGALVLIGLRRRWPLLVMAGLAMACVTRSAAAIFLPALVVLAVLTTARADLVRSTVRHGLYLATALAATLAVVWLQYRHIGQWFAAVDAQRGWDHRLGRPGLPFDSWGSVWVQATDLAAAAVGCFAGWWVVRHLYRRVRGSAPSGRGSRPEQLFSLLYLAGVTASVLLFQGGNLHSLNRYVFATPFYLVFLITALEPPEADAPTGGDRIAWAVACPLVALAVLTSGLDGRYTTLHLVLLLAAVPAVVGLGLVPRRRLLPWLPWAVYGASVALQASHAVDYLRGAWVA